MVQDCLQIHNTFVRRKKFAISSSLNIDFGFLDREKNITGVCYQYQ